MRVYAYLIKEYKEIKQKLEPYFYETRNINSLWTPAGIFYIKENKIFRVHIKDVPALKTMLGAFPVTLDASEFVSDSEESYQVPPQSQPEYIIQHVYRLTPTNPLEWIFEYDNTGEILQNNYFYLPNHLIGTDHILSAEQKSDILSFLNCNIS